MTLFDVRRVLLLCATLAAASRGAQAQRDVRENVNAWFTWFGDIEVDERWSVDYDVSLRRSGPLDEPAQSLWRVGIRRNVSPNVRIAIGYAGSLTYPYGEVPIAYRTPEHRIWENVQLSHAVWRLLVTHRYRIEQRWSGRVGLVNGEETVQNWVRTNRGRYLARATVPLQGGTLDADEWFVNASSEVFLSWGANVQQNVLDQHRLQGTVGRRIGTRARLELGFLEQLVQKPNGRQLERNHTLMTIATTSFGSR